MLLSTSATSEQCGLHMPFALQCSQPPHIHCKAVELFFCADLRRFTMLHAALFHCPVQGHHILPEHGRNLSHSQYTRGYVRVLQASDSAKRGPQHLKSGVRAYSECFLGPAGL